MYADFDIRCTDAYPLGTFCKCGRTVHLKKREAAKPINYVTCPYCGYMMTLIRPRPEIVKIDID